MAKERQIRCDCGAVLREEKTRMGEIETEAMVCPQCHFTTLTKQQAEKYVVLKQLHQIIDAERKIIKIGNSMGLTLPDQLRTFGLKEGKRVRMEALSPTSFKVEMGM